MVDLQYRPSWWSFLHPDLTGGLLAIIVFLLLMAVANLVSFVNNITSDPEALKYLVPTLLYGLPAVGLMRLKRWARYFELIYSILMVALGIFLLIAVGVGMGAFVIVTHGLVAVYLLSGKCRRAFYSAETGRR